MLSDRAAGYTAVGRGEEAERASHLKPASLDRRADIRWHPRDGRDRRLRGRTNPTLPGNRSRRVIVLDDMGRLSGRIVQVSAALAAMGTLAFASTAWARPLALTRGTTAGTRWELTVSRATIGSKLPALCFAFMFGDGYGDGGTNCVAPAMGHSVAGPPWTFDPGAQPYDGLAPPTITRTTGGLRAITFLTVSSARRVVVRLTDGELLRLTPIAIPSALHRPGAIALSVRQIGSSLPSMVAVKSGVAYDADGGVVGRFSRKAPPLENFTYG
jgi:hypothetical protein